MRVLLLGGTGAMGHQLAGILAGNGVDVTVTSRSRPRQDGNVTYVQGNAQDLEFTRGVLSRGWDCIVDFMVYPTATFASRAELFLSSTSQYVFLSSARVFADSPTPIEENSPRLLDVSTDRAYLQTDEYALAKAREENTLVDSKYRGWTIVRPYITYGPDRLQLGYLEKELWLYRATKGRAIVFSKDVCQRLTTLTHGYDVSRGIAALIGNPAAVGEAFNITGADALRWGDILDLYLGVIEQKTGRRPRVVLQDLDGSVASYSNKPQIVYDRMYDRVFNPAKIDKFIDTSTFIKPKDGLRRCLETFLESPRFLDINWRYEAVRDRITNERAGFREMPTLKDRIRYSLARLNLATT